MAEWTEVMKQFKRMCACGDCRKVMDRDNIYQCRIIAFERPAEFERRVMAWAAEHPEPVYETWFEYLLRIGVIPVNAPAGGEYQWIVESIKHKHISNDIAESLKLHPKEVQS